jgi:hypothetical protein
MPSSAVMMMRERSRESKPVKTAAAIGPTESEIATLAYQLWQDNGCPAGSDQEDWFLAKASLKSALAAKGQDPSGRPSVPRDDTGTEFEMLAEFRWEGHWVVWEREWGGARWV